MKNLREIWKKVVVIIGKTKECSQLGQVIGSSCFNNSFDCRRSDVNFFRQLYGQDTQQRAS